jgi:hypothetical protein
MPHLCEFYPGICLTTEEKSRKTSVRLRKTSVRVCLYLMVICNSHIYSMLYSNSVFYYLLLVHYYYIGCPTTHQTQPFFNNSKTNEDIAKKQTHTTDIFVFISHTTNILLFKSRCSIFMGFRIIIEMPGLVSSGTPCTVNKLTSLCT